MKKFYIVKSVEKSQIQEGDLTNQGLVECIKDDRVSISGSMQTFDLKDIEKVKIELVEHIDKPVVAKDSHLYHQIHSIQELWKEYEQNEKKQIKLTTNPSDYSFWLSREYVVEKDFDLKNGIAIPMFGLREEKELELWYELLQLLENYGFPDMRDGDVKLEKLRKRFILKERKI